jgi:NAD(P)-dependent dehydrogenase (short-subunit alcohol dehydrogenase family)
LYSLVGRVILITGSGQGLGRAIALAAAEAGATVILHGRKVSRLESVYDEIVARDRPQPFIFPLDLATAAAPDFAAMAQAIQAQAGRLDGIVHNAALLASLSPIEQQSLDQWLNVLRVNLAAPFALTRACVPLLSASPDASVVFTLDTRGQEPKAFWGGYAASKAGLAALVGVLADEWENRANLRVNGVVPGPMDSPMRKQTHPGGSLEPLPSPEELAPLYLHLVAGQTKAESGTIVDARRWLSERGK